MTRKPSFLPHADNVMEAQAAYDAAINAVFEQQIECHRHVQTHVSAKNGHRKWTMMEMWPMLVQLSLAHFVTAHIQCCQTCTAPACLLKA